MFDDRRWVTLKDGRHIFISKKDTNDYINSLIKEEYKRKDIIAPVHITKEENVEKIKKEGFDLSKAGSAGGSAYGKGVYFATGKNESMFYKVYLNSTGEIRANIDTTGFLVINYGYYASRLNGENNAWDRAASFLKPNEQKQYRDNITKLTASGKDYYDIKQEALIPILEKNYPGIIIKQNTPAFDSLTGGNQIVVYDTKRIKIKE